jgi:hypothetical protein
MGEPFRQGRGRARMARGAGKVSTSVSRARLQREASEAARFFVGDWVSGQGKRR